MLRVLGGYGGLRARGREGERERERERERGGGEGMEEDGGGGVAVKQSGVPAVKREEGVMEQAEANVGEKRPRGEKDNVVGPMKLTLKLARKEAAQQQQKQVDGADRAQANGADGEAVMVAATGAADTRPNGVENNENKAAPGPSAAGNTNASTDRLARFNYERMPVKRRWKKEWYVGGAAFRSRAYL